MSMSPFAHNPFITSRFPVHQNAIKNILFRGATIILTFVIYQLFTFLAFRQRDYTSYLMFAEDLIQKFLFSLSRKFNRQTVLVAAFAVLTFAAGFYDTLLWAVDSPGYVIKSKTVNAEVLAKQVVATPSYITFISNPERDLNKIDIQNIFGANLYSPGLNFTLPGIVDAGTPQPISPLKPLSALAVSPRIWLDSTGFAVGLDDMIMLLPDMNTTDTLCFPSNVPPASATTPVTAQAWKCPLRNTDALQIFERPLGQPQYWWDSNTTSDYLRPRRADNPWVALRTGGDTALMKQIFTVTKALRRHTFLQKTFKTTMISYLPEVFSDADVTDLINRLWGNPDRVITPAVQRLVNTVLQAQNNKTSLIFGMFEQEDEGTVVSYSTEYLYLINPVGGDPTLAVLRFASTVITLVDSETLLKEPVPLAACHNGSATNIGTGGVVHSMTCMPEELGALRATPSRFLGQLDTTSMAIINNILGEGSRGSSAIALNQTGVDWYNTHAQDIENLLTSRSLILNGRGSKVTVDVQTNEAAISYLQLLLIVFPIFLALIVRGARFGKPMGYYENSFLAAVFATVHVNDTTSKVGYMRHPPEVVLKTHGGKVTLEMPNGGLITAPGGRMATDHDDGLIFEPLILPEKDDIERNQI